jgi:hypothetical protein
MSASARDGNRAAGRAVEEVAHAAFRRSRVARQLHEESDARMRSGIVSLVYLVIGAVVASSHHYFTHASTLKPLVSALLAVVFWPLLLLGISLHIK